MTDSIIPQDAVKGSNIPARWANIPNELKQRKQWVLWKMTTRNGKPTKIPYSLEGTPADTTNPETWTSYEQAVEVSGGYSGIGFVFTADDPYVGVDIDHCMTDGKISDDSISLIQKLSSYTEISQSASGIHIIVKAKKPGSRNRKDPYEIYDQGRYFAMTGDHLSGTSPIIEENQGGLNDVYRLIFPEGKKESTDKPTANAGGLDLSEQDIIGVATAAKNGALFKSLYSGDIQGYPSQSEADQAFCNLLAFYSKDFNQINQIFKSSGLYRAKWDRADYKTSTINKAIADSTGSYKPKKPRLSIVPSPEDMRADEAEANKEKIETKALDIFEGRRSYLSKQGYAINAFGELCTVKYDQDMKPCFVKLSNFIAWPVREIALDNGIERRTDFEIKGVLSGSQKLRPVMVSADDFSGMKWVIKEWGLRTNVYPGQAVKDKVRHAIQSLAKDIKHETVFTHMGWRKFNDKWVYLHADGAVGDSSVLVDLKKEGLLRYRLPEKGDDIKASVVEAMQILKVAPNSVTFPLFGLAYLAPLCEPLRKAGIEPAFVVWLNGLTGSLKSTIAALFLSYFGDFTGKTLPASFKDTANAIELKSFLTKDSILVVDDYHPTASIKEAATMGSIAQQLLRGYGDRVGRSRMRADTTLRPSYSPQGLCIVTGEDAPNAGQSTTARYMELVLSKGEVNFDILNKLQANTKVLGQTMRSYIESIDIDTLPDKLRDMYVELRARATKPDQHSRIPETVAWLQLGIGMGLTHAVAVGAITDNEKASLLKTGWNTLIELAEKQAMSVDTEQPAKQFISALSEMLSGGSVYTYFYTENAAIGDSNFIGWNDADFYYLLPTITYNALSKFYSAHGGHFSVSASTLWRHLETANIIVVQKDKTQTYRLIKKVLGGQRIRVLQLKKQSLE